MRNFITAACAALAMATPAAFASDLDVGDAISMGAYNIVVTEAPELCIDRRKSAFRALDNRTLLFQAGEDLYVSRLSKTCDALFIKGAKIDLTTDTQNICRNDSVHVFKHADDRIDTCSLGAFSKVQVYEGAPAE